MDENREAISGPHIERLEDTVRDVQQSLSRIVENDRLAELFRIWKQPGWTTPAEFFLTMGHLHVLSEQVRSVEKQIDRVVRGASKVEAITTHGQ